MLSSRRVGSRCNLWPDHFVIISDVSMLRWTVAMKSRHFTKHILDCKSYRRWIFLHVKLGCGVDEQTCGTGIARLHPVLDCKC